MPIYEYKCKVCNHIFEELVFSSLSSTEDIICPKCGANTTEKMMSAFSSAGSTDSGYSTGSSCGTSGFS